MIGNCAGLIGMFLGSLVMLGWIVESPSLIQVLPAFAPMQFNTALCFLLSGASLVALSQRQTTASFWLGLSVFSFTSITLSQYIFDYSIGLDDLLMEPYITTKTSHPGRMAPNTALCFMLFGLATALESVRISKHEFTKALYLSELLSPLILALATMSLFGYIFRNEMAVAWARLTGMALHTTIGFIILGIGLSFVVWSHHENENIRRGFWLSAFLLFLCLALDISQPLGVAAGVAYVPLVFCSYWFSGRYAAFSFAAIATVLTIVGYFTSSEGSVPEIYVIFNRLLAILAIWVTAFAVHYRKQTESNLQQSQLELKNAIEEVEQFTYIASHDLRAPLRAIDNLAQWLEDDLSEVLQDDTRKNMSLLRGRVRRLDKLLDDILSFSRIGKPGQKVVRVDLGGLLDNIGELTYLSENFQLEVKGPMPVVQAPEGAMELIFANLINNAIKHHDRETGTVKISFREDGNEWVFSIEDDGPGIPEKYRDQVFDMFKTLVGRDKKEGSGMGLSIVKKLVSLSNGKVWVEGNKHNRGARLSFSWSKDSID